MPDTTSLLRSVLIAALVVAVITTVYVAATPDPQTTGEVFTELSVLGADGRANDYPDALAPGEMAPLVVRVTNQEGQTVPYQLRVRWNDSWTQTRTFDLSHGGTWQQRVTVEAPDTPSKYRLQVWLYRLDANSSTPYRTARLTVSVGNGTG